MTGARDRFADLLQNPARIFQEQLTG